MINSIIAYNTTELEKKKVLSEARNLYKSKMLNEEQWQKIREEYSSKLYTPSVFMKILFFIFSIIGMTTIIGPIAAIFGHLGESGYRFISFFLGILIIFLTDKVLIKNKFHFKSGITEAGIYSGLSFIAFGLLGFETNNVLVYLIVGLLLAAFASIRYLNLVSLVLTIGFFCWILFRILTDIGGIVETLLPFIFLAIFGIIYLYGVKLENKLSNVIFEDQFILLKTIALVIAYLAVNYYVVRELSIRLKGLELSEKEDIPFAIIFYIMTIIIPIGYIYWGIKKKSILFIRVGLLTAVLSAVTFKYYFSLGYPVIAAMVSGAVLILIALVLIRYLKKIRGGFTRELLLHDKWSSQDLTAIIASQTMGGNKISGAQDDGVIFKGGRFGGAGAGGTF
jgi:hypothetical protein